MAKPAQCDRLKAGGSFKMQEFMYSLNATLPVFFVMLLGWLLKQKGMLNENFSKVGNAFVFGVALPVMLFKSAYETDWENAVSKKFILFCALGTLATFALVWSVSALVLKDSCILGSFVQGSSRSNVAILGVAFVQNMYGAAGAAAIMVGIVVPLANVCSVLLLSVCGPRDTGASGKQQLATALRNVCKNPLILSILLGMAVSFSGFQLPPIVAKTVGSVAALATPLSLIVLGAGFGGREALKKWKPTAAASAIKLLALPALLLPLALLLGFRGQELASLVIMTGAPTAVSSYIMAQNMHNDAELASSIVAATTLLSSATLTFWIFLLKSLSFL